MSTQDLQAPVSARAQLSFRPAAAADARLFAELSFAYRPDEPEDPELVRYYWENPTPGYSRERFMVEAADTPVGFAEHLEPVAERDPERNGEIQAWLVPAAASSERQLAVLEFIEERAAAAGVRILTSGIWEDDSLQAQALLARGFSYDRLSKAWDLDLIENRDRLLLLAGRSAALIAEQGITCHAIAEDPDPEIWANTFAAVLDAERDVPRTEPYIPHTFEQFMNWHSDPGTSPRWFFVAKDGDRVVAVSTLRFPPVQGNVWTGFTGVARSHRGRGIARGVKLAILKQAIDENVSRVRTDNDETNLAMLHINEELGYQRIPGIASYRKLPA